LFKKSCLDKNGKDCNIITGKTKDDVCTKFVSDKDYFKQNDDDDDDDDDDEGDYYNDSTVYNND
jgi:hypothetical protein